MNYDNEYLLFKKIITSMMHKNDSQSFDIFIILEKLLVSISIIEATDRKYNTEFSSEDFVDLYTNLVKSDRCIKILQEQYLCYCNVDQISPDMPNYYHMISGERNPNIPILKALKYTIFDSCFDKNDNNEYFPIDTPFDEIVSNYSTTDIEQYLSYYNFISKQNNSSKDTISDLDTLINNMTNENIISCYRRDYKPLISHYLKSISLNDEEFCNYSEADYYPDFLEESEYEISLSVERNYSDEKYDISNNNLLKRRLFDTSNEILLFLRENTISIIKHDNYFIALLYLTHFLTEEELELLNKYQSSKLYSIYGENRNNYMNDVQFILQIPSYPRPSLSYMAIHENLVNDVLSIFTSLKLDNHIGNMLLLMTESQLITAKYIYLTDILPEKYTKQSIKRNKFFMSDAMYKTFNSFNNCNIKKALSINNEALKAFL